MLYKEVAAYLDAGLLLLIAAAYIISSRKLEQRQDPLLIVILASYALVVVSVTLLAGGNLEEARLEALGHALTVPLSLFSLAYACPRMLSRRHYLSIFICLLAVFSIHAILTLWLCLSQTHTFLSYDISIFEGRCPALFGYAGSLVTGLTWNPNTLATSLMLLPALAARVEESAKSKFARRAARVFLTVIFIHLVLTLSRAAILTVILSITLWSLFSKSGSRLSKILSLSALVITFLYVLLQLGGFSSDASMAERIRLWTRSIEQISLSPWGCALPAGGTERMPHNFFLATAQYFGIQGLFLLLLFIGRLVLRARTRVQKGTAAQLALLTVIMALFCHGSVEYFIGHPTLFANSLFWLTIGYLSCMREVEDSHVPTPLPVH